MSKEKFTKDVSVRIKVPGMEKYKTAVVFGVDYRGYYVLKPKVSKDGHAEINLPQHGAASMILLTENFVKLRKRNTWAKFKEPAIQAKIHYG
jgi:hypothetical protein